MFCLICCGKPIVHGCCLYIIQLRGTPTNTHSDLKAPSQLHKHISQQLLIRTYCGHEEKNSMLNMYTEMPLLPSILSTPSQRKAKVERQEIHTVILGFSSSTSSSLLASSASCRCINKSAIWNITYSHLHIISYDVNPYRTKRSYLEACIPNLLIDAPQHTTHLHCRMTKWNSWLNADITNSHNSYGKKWYPISNCILISGLISACISIFISILSLHKLNKVTSHMENITGSKWSLIANFLQVLSVPEKPWIVMSLKSSV